jgi:hypothetical protein
MTATSVIPSHGELAAVIAEAALQVIRDTAAGTDSRSGVTATATTSYPFVALLGINVARARSCNEKVSSIMRNVG